MNYRHKFATALTLALPAVVVSLPPAVVNGQQIPLWRAFWNLFGTSNQLLAALALPPLMLVTSASDTSFDAWIAGLAGILARDRVIVQVREKGLDALRVQHLLSRTLARTEPFGCPVVVNSACGRFAQADGVHLTAADLAAATQRPGTAIAGASCHDRTELEKAATLGLDYAILGPVKPTASHPGAPGLGWSAFADLVRDLPMPVYGIGGLTRVDLAEARRHGAHGIAMRSAAFGD